MSSPVVSSSSLRHVAFPAPIDVGTAAMIVSKIMRLSLTVSTTSVATSVAAPASRVGAGVEVGAVVGLGVMSKLSGAHAVRTARMQISNNVIFVERMKNISLGGLVVPGFRYKTQTLWNFTCHHHVGYF